jgi:hypothetical protein
MMAAIAADVVREGPYGSAWFAHRDDAGMVTHIEIRGPTSKARSAAAPRPRSGCPARPG